MRTPQGYSPRSNARLLSALRAFCAQQLRLGLREDDPTARLDPPRLGRPLPKALSESQVEALIQAADTTAPAGLRDRAALITAGRLFKFTLSGKARLVKYMSGTDAEVLEYTVAPNSAITKGTLKDISFPKDAVIGGLIRGSESYIAIGSTRIEPYDRVVVFALPHTVKDIDRLFR